MSHFTVVNTQIVSQEHLVKALQDMGFHAVESHELAMPLEGWLGDSREQQAEVIVRKQYVGHASNDIGFARQPDGTFIAYISEYDRSRYNHAWLKKLTQRYAYHVAMDKLQEQDFTLVEEEVEEDNSIRLTLRRMG